MDSKPRIFMYSHDSYGLGHLRRTLALAKAFVEHDPGPGHRGGRIVERGTHGELRVGSERYHQLHELKPGRHEESVRER